MQPKLKNRYRQMKFDYECSLTMDSAIYQQLAPVSQ